MPRRENAFSQMESKINKQTDCILNQPKSPTNYNQLTREQFDAEIEEGFSQYAAGKISAAKDVKARLRRDYGI